MATLETQADSPYGYLSGFNSRNFNLNATCSAWPLHYVDSTSQNGFHRRSSMLPSSPNQPLASKEILKHIILQHEATFREQIHHLHHLYNKQRELMDDIRNNANRHHLRLDMLHSNPFLSETSVYYAPEASRISPLHWVHHAPDIPVDKNNLLNASFSENTGLARSANEQTGSSIRDSELTKSTLKKIGKKVLDLELPAYEYMGSEEEEEYPLAPTVPGYDLNIVPNFLQENGVEPLLKKNDHIIDIIKGDNIVHASSSWAVKPLVDLNEPIILDDQEEEKADAEAVSPARHNVFSPSYNVKISSKCEVPVEHMTQNICLKEDPEYCSNVLNVSTESHEESISGEHVAGEKSLSCPPESDSDLTETFLTSVKCAEVEQVQEAIKVSDAKDAKLIPIRDTVSKSGRSCVLVANKHVHELSSFGFTIDLNSCINEIGCSGTLSPSTEVDMRELENSKVKDGSRGTGESNKNEVESDLSSSDGSGSSLDELVRTAADSIVTISSSWLVNCVETLQLKPLETWTNGCLNWFARIVASAIDDPTSEFGVALSCKHSNYKDEPLCKELDFFEEMTLNLEEIEEQEYSLKPIFVAPEVSMASQPTRARTRMRRLQRKNFQNEVLPSLASLSRHEVTKDLQAIRGMIETTRRSHNSGLRRPITNEWSEVTRRRRGRPSNADNAVSASGRKEANGIRVGWGNITRGRRGSRRRPPAFPTRLNFGQG